VNNDLLELPVYSIVVNVSDCVIQPSHTSHGIDMRQAQAFLAMLYRHAAQVFCTIPFDSVRSQTITLPP
jgi:cupin superfamily acireductone dioxygenase involved in methionine salvage